MCLADVLITAFCSLAEDSDSLILELEESKHTREDLVATVTNHKKTIEILRKQKSDLLVEIADQRETIVKPWTKSKPESSERGKEIVSEEYLRLEDEVKAMRCRMCAEPEKNELLQTNLEKVMNDLESSLKWTWSSEATTALLPNNSEKRQGAGFQREKTPHNPHKIVKGSVQQWFMDSGCSKHMTGNTTDFLSLKVVQGGNVSFGNGKKGYILGVGKVGRSLAHSIENVYYVNGLKYSLLSVSQICDKGNKVEFLSKICIVTDLVTGEIVLVAKRYKNIYVVDFESLQSCDLSCLKVVDNDAEL
ncbi:uncharacterized protein [Nicotiana sylvestris]|uniref:uncharacterized protein n=1 Tax=Nicotiana sylvestris TaxID=4096 RepID=UPI00388C7631